jgi:hypothetical protein
VSRRQADCTECGGSGRDKEDADKAFRFFSVFDCSTGHMSKQDDDKLKDKECPLAVYDYEFGCFLYVACDDVVEAAIHAGFSSAFVDLIRIARKAGCKFICLDGDGTRYEDLPYFEW